jgi:hypothetical protein
MLHVTAHDAKVFALGMVAFATLCALGACALAFAGYRAAQSDPFDVFGDDEDETKPPSPETLLGLPIVTLDDLATPSLALARYCADCGVRPAMRHATTCQPCWDAVVERARADVRAHAAVRQLGQRPR